MEKLPIDDLEKTLRGVVEAIIMHSRRSATALAKSGHMTKGEEREAAVKGAMRMIAAVSHCTQADGALWARAVNAVARNFGIRMERFETGPNGHP